MLVFAGTKRIDIARSGSCMHNVQKPHFKASNNIIYGAYNVLVANPKGQNLTKIIQIVTFLDKCGYDYCYYICYTRFKYKWIYMRFSMRRDQIQTILVYLPIFKSDRKPGLPKGWHGNDNQTDIVGICMYVLHCILNIYFIYVYYEVYDVSTQTRPLYWIENPFGICKAEVE